MPHGESWVARLSKSGWTLFGSEDEALAQSNEEHIAALSNEFDTYVCNVNETVTLNAAEFWQSGQRKWRLSHRGDGGKVFHLKEEDALPGHYQKLRDACFADQQSDGDEVDHIFEIPLDLVAVDIDFRHDNYLAAADVEKYFPVASRVKQGFLASLFVRR